MIVPSSRQAITVEARPEDQPRIREFIEEALRATPLAERGHREVRLAVDEACANIIEHAYGGRAGSIEVEVTVHDGEVAITLRDTGRPFDAEQVGTPDLSRYVKTGKKGGFGLYLIHKTMDEVRRDRVEDSNVLTLVKRYTPRRESRAARLKSRLLGGSSRSLRARIFVQSSLLLTLLLVSVAAVLVSRAGTIARREALGSGIALAAGLRAQAVDLLLRPQAFGPKQTQLNAAAKTAVARAQIARLVVADSAGTVWAASDENMVFTELELPERVIVLPADTDGSLNEFLGTYEPVGGQHVLALPVVAPRPRGVRGESGSPRRLGMIYVTVLEETIARRVSAARQDTLIVAGLVLIAGLVAVGLLVRLVVKPIQRLTEGVRAIGSGQEQRLEEAGFEEIDAIARAFNEVTGKFRDAQQSLVERERLQQEVEVAKSIQHSLLPRELPQMSGFEIGTLYRAAKEVGGDYYDFVRVSDDTWGLAVADVSGKGVPASMVMMMIRTALRLEARGERAAADVLERVNRFVTADMKKGMFVTMFYVVLDSRERLLSYASAGHNPMVLYRGRTDETFFLKPSGFPVGIDLPDEDLFSRSISVERVALEQDDILVVYTDGITEAMNAQMEQFGTKRLLEAIKRYAHHPPQEFCLHLEQELADFTGDTPQNDDITLVAIKERLSASDLKVEARERLLRRVEVDGVPLREACRELGVSPSTYYRYRRLRETGGREGLRDRRKRPQPARLSNEQEEILVGLIRQDPDSGARPLAEALGRECGEEVKPTRVSASLRRLKLNNKAARRALAGWVQPERTARPRPRRRKPPKKAEPAAAPVVETPVDEMSPEESPVAEELPVESPVAEESPVESPAAEELPEESPAAEELPDESPVAEELPEGSPVAEELPEESPAAEELPEELPVAEEPPEESPVAEELPDEIPAEESGEASPIEVIDLTELTRPDDIIVPEQASRPDLVSPPDLAEAEREGPEDEELDLTGS